MSDIKGLEGRIDGIAQALLRVVAELEVQQIIDGPHLSEALRNARPERVAQTPVLQMSRKVLLQLAEHLDDARQRRACR